MAVIGTLVEVWTEKAILLKAQTKARDKVLEAKCGGHLCYAAVKNWPQVCALLELCETQNGGRGCLVLTAPDSTGGQLSVHVSGHEP